jgi:hypothetical protein
MCVLITGGNTTLGSVLKRIGSDAAIIILSPTKKELGFENDFMTLRYTEQNQLIVEAKSANEHRMGSYSSSEKRR